MLMIDRHWPLCSFCQFTFADDVLWITSEYQYGRLPMSGWENHRTCLEDCLLARHLQSILNIFFPVSHSFSPVSGSKRNPKEWKVREIFIHSFMRPSVCQELSGSENTTVNETCFLFLRTLNSLTSKYNSAQELLKQQEVQVIDEQIDKELIQAQGVPGLKTCLRGNVQ